MYNFRGLTIGGPSVEATLGEVSIGVDTNSSDTKGMLGGGWLRVGGAATRVIEGAMPEGGMWISSGSKSAWTSNGKECAEELSTSRPFSH